MLKKKIGILTFFYSNDNYGALLQTFSIYNLVKKLGYDPYIIDFYPAIPATLKAKIHQVIKKTLGFEFERFRRAYFKKTPPSGKNGDGLVELNKSLDGFLVGSDQVWRYRQDEKALYRYFLDFVDDQNVKISYGASFGVDYWEGDSNSSDHISALMERFKSISVREGSGVDICKDVFKVDASLVLDPTLVLEKKHFFELVKNIKIKPPKSLYLAYMVLDDSPKMRMHFKNLAKSKGLKFIDIKGVPLLPRKNFFLLNKIEKWLFLICNAEIVVTDSFHCTVFSSIFNKGFICVANERRGIARLENFLKLIGQEKRFYQRFVDIDENRAFLPMDYTEIEKKLENARKESLEYLEKNLPR